MKELTFKDLDDGVIVVGPSGDKFKLHRTWHKTERAGYCSTLISLELTLRGFFYTVPKTPEQIAYEALQAKIAEEEARHADSIKALREQAEKLKPRV